MPKIATGRNIALLALISCCFFPTQQTVGALRQGRENSGALTNGIYLKASGDYSCPATEKADSRLWKKVVALIPGCAKTRLIANSIDSKISIDTNTKYQIIDGFGVFGAMDTWWGKPEGLYSDKWADQVFDDLGITIWRNEYYPPATANSPQDADWSKQRPVVEGLAKKARDKGIDLKIILTVWSPPESMKCAISADGKLIDI